MLDLLYKGGCMVNIDVSVRDITMATFCSASSFPTINVPMLLILGLLVSCLNIAGVQSIGVSYGMEGSDLPSKQEVVEMYKSRNIESMRLYDSNQEALYALRGSQIQVTIGLPNDQLQKIAASQSEATSWFQNNMQNYWSDVKFRYIAVGNGAIPGDKAQFVLPAMQNIYNATAAAGIQGQVRVSTAVHPVVLRNLRDFNPPSNSSFSDEAAATLGPIIQFLVRTQAPLLSSVYPYISFIKNMDKITLPYALFTSQSAVVTDGRYQYQNLFDAMVDSMYSALEKAGGSGVEIVVSETGWPSAGNVEATIDNARIYHQNLIQHVKKGTPKKPGKPVETNLFAMFNENRKPTNGDLGEAERHFGLFYPNKTPVYQINFNYKVLYFVC